MTWVPTKHARHTRLCSFVFVSFVYCVVEILK